MILVIWHTYCLIFLTGICSSNGLDTASRHRRDAEEQIYEEKTRPFDIQKQRHKEIVNIVNRTPNATWRAAYNPSGPLELITKPKFFTTHYEEFKKSLYGMGDKRYLAYRSTKVVNDSVFLVSEATKFATTGITDKPLPKEFDARAKWTKCSNLHQPTTNQGGCGGCYAVSSVSVISDRICISSNQTLDVHLSAIDAIGCNTEGVRCAGGYEPYIFVHWVRDGIVTGGPYGSEEGCRPFEVHSKCGSPCPIGNAPDVQCVRKCRDLYTKNYSDDKYYGKNYYTIVNREDETSRANAEENMKRELYERGPIVTSFAVPEDFIHYKSGVYQMITGENVYFHSVKLIGWGEENGVPYWLLANSWGRDWGDRGFFKFLRGSNHLFIETDVFAGTPLIKEQT